MTDEQQKDVEAANHLRGRAHACVLESRTVQAYHRAISALEDRAKAPPMRQISRQEVEEMFSRVNWLANSTLDRLSDLACNLLRDHGALAEPASEPHPLDALKLPNDYAHSWSHVCGQVNALIDYLKQQEAKQP